ncbi:MAG: hypothetical protein LKE30_05785 [Bacteroidales bacterium]|jgi:DNA-binding transcriptional MerR regulator|nr:hypothetical protein [Bacteroidales bacterium]
MIVIKMINIKEVLENKDDQTPRYYTNEVLAMLNISKRTLDRYRLLAFGQNKNTGMRKRLYSCKEIADIIDVIKYLNGFIDKG